MRMLKDKKGISLIALVVSVIILIIIAGVSARLLIGNDGVLQNASDLNDSYKLTIINERLDYIALSKRTYNPNKTLKVDEYIQSLENQNDFDLTDVQKVDDSKAYIVIDNSYEYYVEIVDKKIKVTYLGSAKDLSPRIVDHNVVYTTHSIKVSVEAWRAKTYKFYISDTEGEDGTLGNENNGECLFDGLTENKKYYLKIVVENGNGSAEKELEVVTKAMPAVGVASISPTGWTNQTITITLPEEAGLTTRYTLDGTTPTKSSTAYNSSNKPTTNENCSVKYIYTDGVNITSAGSITIANYDNLQPNTFTPTATSTTNSIVVTAVATDHAATSTSGQSNGIEYAFKLNNGEYTAYQASGTYTFDSLTQTTDYTITVKAKDAAGNVREGEVSKGTGTIPTVGEASISPTGWTNGNVTVTLPKETNYTTRYTLDGTTPTKTSTQYTEPFTVTGNCSVKFIYTDGTNINTASSISVANIDKLAPNAFTPSGASTTRSITVTAVATDQTATGASGQSNGITYAFKLNNGSYTSYQENGTYTFDNLTQTTNYTVTVSAKDAAGNITEGSVSKGTGTIPTVGEASISPTGWTNQTITITLPEEAGFTTRYTLDGTTPTKDSTAYNSSSKPTTNANCTVKWIYTDGTNITTAGARTIANYDNLAPNTFTPTSTSTTNSIVVTAVATDHAATSTSGQSNGIEYAFKLNNGEYTAYQENGTYTFDSLTQTTNYTVTVRAKDAAGNITEGSVSKGTGTIPTVGEASISPTGWTNGNVTVTLPIETNYTTRYTLDGTTPTKISTQYTEPFTVTGNCSVKFIYTDGTNINTASSISVANIDKLAPNAFTVTTSNTTTSSVKVSADTTDQEAANGSGQSGNIEYRFSSNNGTNYTSWQASGDYTFTGLTQTTGYTFKVQAKDAAGNVTTGATTSSTTLTLPVIGEASISPTDWTNGNVTVTLPTETNYTTRYTLDGTTPTKTSTQYSAPFTVTGNCSVKFIYTDGTNINNAGALTVSNIDKLAPGAFTPTTSDITTSSVKVSASTTDQAATAANGKSDGIKYAFSKDNGSTWTSFQESGDYTFTGLTQGTTYTFKVKAKDAAGNEIVGSGTLSQTTEATVTYEDWFVDESNNKKIKLGSTTGSAACGTTVSGSDKGTSTTVDAYYTYYVYKSSTSATVGTSGATVYRYFWGWNNINIYGPNGAESTDSSVATFSVSYNGGAYLTGQFNEVEESIVLPYGATIRVKDIEMIQTGYKLSSVTWGGNTISPSNGEYTVTVTSVGNDFNINTSSTYKYIKMHVTEKKGIDTNGCIQMSEIKLLRYINGSYEEYEFPVETKVTASLAAVTSSESASMLIDGNINTKYCTTGWGANATGNLVVTIELPTGIDISEYRYYAYYTGNDVESRDPVTWKLYISNTGNDNDWVEVDSKTNANIPSARKSRTDVYEFANKYKYIEMFVTERRGTGDVCVQMSEIKLLRYTNGSYEEYEFPTGTISTATKAPAADNETASMLVDGNINTKYCTRNWYKRRTGQVGITIELPTALDFSEYKYYAYYTGNDGSWRDPVTWKVCLGMEGDYWIKADSRENVSIPMERNTRTDIYEFSI